MEINIYDLYKKSILHVNNVLYMSNDGDEHFLPFENEDSLVETIKINNKTYYYVACIDDELLFSALYLYILFKGKYAAQLKKYVYSISSDSKALLKEFIDKDVLDDFANKTIAFFAKPAHLSLARIYAKEQKATKEDIALLYRAAKQIKKNPVSKNIRSNKLFHFSDFPFDFSAFFINNPNEFGLTINYGEIVTTPWNITNYFSDLLNYGNNNLFFFDMDQALFFFEDYTKPDLDSLPKEVRMSEKNDLHFAINECGTVQLNNLSKSLCLTLTSALERLGLFLDDIYYGRVKYHSLFNEESETIEVEREYIASEVSKEVVDFEEMFDSLSISDYTVSEFQNKKYEVVIQEIDFSAMSIGFTRGADIRFKYPKFMFSINDHKSGLALACGLSSVDTEGAPYIGLYKKLDEYFKKHGLAKKIYVDDTASLLLLKEFLGPKNIKKTEISFTEAYLYSTNFCHEFSHIFKYGFQGQNEPEPDDEEEKYSA